MVVNPKRDFARQETNRALFERFLILNLQRLHQQNLFLFLFLFLLLLFRTHLHPSTTLRVF
jgi:hypothetical protein